MSMARERPTQRRERPTRGQCRASTSAGTCTEIPVNDLEVLRRGGQLAGRAGIRPGRVAARNQLEGCPVADENVRGGMAHGLPCVPEPGAEQAGGGGLVWTVLGAGEAGEGGWHRGRRGESEGGRPTLPAPPAPP